MSDTLQAMGCAVIGAGAWGQNHVRSFVNLPGVELRYVCDQRDTVLARMHATYPAVSCVNAMETVIDDPKVRAVVIATDAPSHYRVALACLQGGKDVLVEKPLALRESEAEELCYVADKKSAILMVGHLLLYHPAVGELKKRIQQGELGDVLYAYAQRLNLGVVRRDENAWWSLAPHDISMINFVLESEPVEVSVQGAAFLQKDQGIEDVVFGTVRYPEGKMAHIHVSWLDPHKTRRLTVVGSKKMAVFDDGSADQKLTLYDKGVEPPPAAVSYAESVRVRTGEIRIPAVKMEEPLRREAEAFLYAVRTREKPVADGRSGLAVVRALEAGARSLKEGGRSIPIRV